MSLVVKLIIAGWAAMFVLVGLCALNESGNLLRIHQRVGEWLRSLAPASITSAEISSAEEPRDREIAA